MIHRLIRIDYVHFTLHWSGRWNSQYSFLRVFIYCISLTKIYQTISYDLHFTVDNSSVFVVFMASYTLAVVQPLSCAWLSATSWTAGSHSFPALDHLPLPSPRVCSNSCPLSQWCHPTISSSVAPSPPAFSLFQHQGFFPVSWFTASGGQSTGASSSASVLPMNIQGWFPLGLTGWISL